MELGAVVHGALRVGALEPRAAAERLSLSSRMLLSVLAGQGSGHAGAAQLARDLRAEIAARGERVLTLVLPAGATADAQQARIDLGGRQVIIPAEWRDALLARLRPAQAALGSAPALAGTALDESGARAWATGASAQASAQASARSVAPSAAQPASQAAALPAAQSALAASVGGISRELLRSIQPLSATAARTAAEVPHVALGDRGLGEPAVVAPVGPVLPVADVAARLRREIERSGLFFESHLAQWAQGERSVDDVRAELLHLAANPSASSMAQAIADGTAQRVSGQLRLLQEPCLAISGAAWPGQPMQMVVEREAPPRDAAPGLPPVFGAHLRLVLPHLGSVEVHLRLAGEAVATTIRAQQPQRLQPGVAVLSDQLRATGLTPVVTQVLAVEGAPA